MNGSSAAPEIVNGSGLLTSGVAHPDNLRLVALGATVTIAYLVAAEIGFRAAFVAEQVTTVWAPTGIALAALLLLGRRLWPAVWLGAFLANAGSDAPLWTAAIIATGNTLEALAGTWALRKLPHFDVDLSTVASVLSFVGIAAAASTMVSAAIGTVTLCAAGVQPWTRFAALAYDWWLGDALGAVIVAPAILTTVSRAWSRRDSMLACLFVAGALGVTAIVFGRRLGVGAHPLEYVVFPVVIAAAVGAGPAVTSLAVLSVSVVSVWHTVAGNGPFAGAEIHRSLILLQVFMGVLAGTALLLAAAIAERRTGERREREGARALRQREEMLQLAQRAGGVATFEWDFRNQLARCSAEFFRIFGLPEGDGSMAASDWARFVHPDDRDPMAAHLTRAIEGAEPAAADYRIIAADGTTKWLSYAGSMQRTADGDRLLGTVVDITDRKRLEAELRHHAAEVERILETIGEGFIALDREFRCIYVNQSAVSMFGRSRDELIGRTVWDVFPAESLHEVKRHLEAAMHSGEAGRHQVHVPGWGRWYENRIYPSADGLSVFFSDVTARVDADIALRQAMTAAESANQLKDQFLATLSHELRTPLNAILGYARMLQTNAIEPDKRRRAIEVIERNAVAQKQLVEDLLDMSRITTGTVRLDPQPVPVVTVLRDAIEGVKPAAEAKRIALDVDVDPFAGTVAADTTRLQQVFWNLLTNAVKFTGQGGRIRAALQRDGTYILVSIQDDGIGISPEFLPFVFEPFRQADARLDRAHGGLGLGLAIAKRSW
jgi:PAS domain S-box-containing protein